MVESALVGHLLDPRSPINIESLLDAITALLIDCKIPSLMRIKSIDSFITRYQQVIEQISQHRLKGSDFRLLKVIGRGAFGEVQLVRHTQTNSVYAMKLLNKDDMIKRSDSAFFWEERDIMAHANSDWIVRLHYAFQDQRYLYMVMEYMPGGDLVNLMTTLWLPSTRWVTFTGACIFDFRFLFLSIIPYIIFRDVKPDNMLISRSGHIKLADFGTCVKMNKNGVIKCSTVSLQRPITLSRGIWNRSGLVVIGVFIYEMLIGETPFFAEALVSTYSNIMDHKNSLRFPDEPAISAHAKDLIRQFLSSADVRLGKSVDKIRSHPFFKNDEWTFETLRNATPPVIPELKGDDDTTHFEDIEAKPMNESFQLPKTFIGNQLPFIGFTYSNELSSVDIVKETSEGILDGLPVLYRSHRFSYRKVADQYKSLVENERLARQIAETNVNEFDKEKTMLKEEVKQLVARHEKVECFELMKLDLEKAHKRAVIVKLEEEMAKRVDKKGGKHITKSLKPAGIHFLLNDKVRMMTDMTREDNDALRMEVKELKEELDEMKRRRDGTIDETRFVVVACHDYCATCGLLRSSRSFSAPYEEHWLCHVRLVTAADVRVADAEQIRRIFHVRPSLLSRINESWKSHDFQELTFHMSTYCDICSKKLSDLVRPPPAYECKNCRLKIHKDHVNTPQLTVCKYTGVVREWLLMALTKEECNQWVSLLQRVMATQSSNPISRVSSKIRHQPSHSHSGSLN
ncbi:unnamed protein product [Heligmosomoides polygyrus]|uniref:non-specific serine/threonine protein kinase n=1 Tax=Heligmosomoides polygyrus TaxID=6339 RepID=A0A183GH65_HELPZ|nr:unnamed protein product [Heligmosomoides polygyrus]